MVVDHVAIQSLCDRIVEEFHPDRVILFGSHTYGVPGPDSDVDMLVILPFEEPPVYKAIEIVTRAESSCHRTVGVDERCTHGAVSRWR
jgi:predicted nucleotidyltransferase